jgi:hypothetical protein
MSSSFRRKYVYMSSRNKTLGATGVRWVEGVGGRGSRSPWKIGGQLESTSDIWTATAIQPTRSGRWRRCNCPVSPSAVIHNLRSSLVDEMHVQKGISKIEGPTTVSATEIIITIVKPE